MGKETVRVETKVEPVDSLSRMEEPRRRDGTRVAVYLLKWKPTWRSERSEVDQLRRTVDNIPRTERAAASMNG